VPEHRPNKRFLWLERGPFPVYLGFTMSKTGWDAEMKGRLGVKEEYPSSDGRTSTFEKEGANLSIVVSLSNIRGRTRNEIYAVLVHEATHVLQFIKEAMREEKPSAEFEAYTMQWLCAQLWAAYEKLRRA
jgi:hypothetical protein